MYHLMRIEVAIYLQVKIIYALFDSKLLYIQVSDKAGLTIEAMI